MIFVRHLFASAGHNYFGHHGMPPGENPIIEVDQIECVAGRGIRGDRFFDFKENYKGQITFFSWETFERLCQELNLPSSTHPSATRRNVMTQGCDLTAMIGCEFEVQGVRFEGVEECRPCYWMNHAIKDGAEIWMNGNGGLRARILTNGILRRDWDFVVDPLVVENCQL